MGDEENPLEQREVVRYNVIQQPPGERYVLNEVLGSRPISASMKEGGISKLSIRTAAYHRSVHPGKQVGLQSSVHRQLSGISREDKLSDEVDERTLEKLEKAIYAEIRRMDEAEAGAE